MIERDYRIESYIVEKPTDPIVVKPTYPIVVKPTPPIVVRTLVGGEQIRDEKGLVTRRRTQKF